MYPSVLDHEAHLLLCLRPHHRGIRHQLLSIFSIHPTKVSWGLVQVCPSRKEAWDFVILELGREGVLLDPYGSLS